MGISCEAVSPFVFSKQMSFLITVELKKTKESESADGKVPVYLKIKEEERLEDSRKKATRRLIPTGIFGFDKEDVESRKEELRPMLCLLYCVLENRIKGGQPFTLDDIVADYGKAQDGDGPMLSVVERSKNGFTYDPEIASMGRIFDTDTDSVFTRELKDMSVSLLRYILVKSDECKGNGQVSVSRSYLSLLRSLDKYSSAGDILFEEITPDFVTGYAEWLKGSGVLESTSSFYLRTLRMVLNHAEEDGYAGHENNLFAGVNTTAHIKSAPEDDSPGSLDTLRGIATADFSDDPLKEIVRDMFMFAFYCRGMEFTDVLNLPKSALADGNLTYRKRQKGVRQTVSLDNEALEIIKKYRDTSADYIFPLAERYEKRSFISIREKLRYVIKSIGCDVNYPKLTFGMNIDFWEMFVSKLDISGILFNDESSASSS